jgi:hypothetical protein
VSAIQAVRYLSLNGVTVNRLRLAGRHRAKESTYETLVRESAGHVARRYLRGGDGAGDSRLAARRIDLTGGGARL